MFVALIIPDMHSFFFTAVAYLLGCTSCFVLQRLGMPPVTSIALTGFTGSFLYFPNNTERIFLHGAIYAGAFAGASSPEIVGSFNELIFLSGIGSIVFHFSRPYLIGVGGKLGLISFVSSLIFFLAKTAW